MSVGARANSFHLTLDAVVGKLSLAHWSLCPVRPTARVWSRGRYIFLRRGDRVARFATVTRDFSDAELGAVVDMGQLYLDVSGKDALDDFARDLIQLAPSVMCASCPVRDACAGMFDPRSVDVFTRDDARVRAALAALRGVVLDLGCGECPYGDVLDPLVSSGKVEYIGLDPDPSRVAVLRRRWPAARVWVAEAEAPPPDLPVPDHVLILRSWNHLRNPVQVVETFARRLLPGGTMTLVDNVAFGVVRGRAAARAAEGSAAAFEHFRNDDAVAVQALVAEVAPWLGLIERYEVGPTTSNQWFLQYRRVA